MSQAARPRMPATLGRLSLPTAKGSQGNTRNPATSEMIAARRCPVTTAYARATMSEAQIGPSG